MPTTSRQLIEQLDLRTSCSSAIRPAAARSRITSAGTARKRVAKAVLVGAVPPLMLKTEANPGGLPIEVFDGIRKGVLDNRSQFFKDLSCHSTATTARARRCRRACAMLLAAGHDGRHQGRPTTASSSSPRSTTPRT